MREQRFQIYDDMAFSIQCKWLLFIAEHIDRVSYVHLACMYIKAIPTNEYLHIFCNWNAKENLFFASTRHSSTSFLQKRKKGKKGKIIEKMMRSIDRVIF